MSKLSKIQSLKQQRRYRNETMNVLNYPVSSKINTPTLADKSLHAFKNIKPEVQSSRLYRPQTSKPSIKNGLNYYIGQSRDKEKVLQISQKNQKISSKSLESRNSACYKSQKKQNQKTKKNSYSRLHTDFGYVQSSKNWDKLMQNNLQRRLKMIQNIFVMNKLQQSQKFGKILHQSPQISRLKNNLSSVQLPTGYINMKHSANGNMKQNVKKASNQLIFEASNKFKILQEVINQRKNKMVFDEIDQILLSIFTQLHNSFFIVFDTLLFENEEKIQDIESSIRKMISDHEQQLHTLSKKLDKIKQNYIQQIQMMLIRSLYVTDKLNVLQQKGILHFEREARIIDGQQLDSQSRKSQLKESHPNYHYFQREGIVKNYYKQQQLYQSQHSNEEFHDIQDMQFDYIGHKNMKCVRDKLRVQNKFNSQNLGTKNLR